MEGTDEEVAASVSPTRRFRRLQRVLIGLALVLLVALIGLWIARKPLAGDVVNRELARRGVPARYTITDLGLGRQRLTNVVIGDPRRPDLVADWLETRTRLTLSGPKVTGVRAGRVRLRGRLVDGRISLGALDRLMPAPSPFHRALRPACAGRGGRGWRHPAGDALWRGRIEPVGAGPTE